MRGTGAGMHGTGGGMGSAAFVVRGGGAGSSAGMPVPLEIATSRRERQRGLLGRDGVEGALLLSPASAVHTVGMRFAVDVAYLDRGMRVRAVRTMRPGRVGLPRLWARHVLEAEAGALGRWGVRAGVTVVVVRGG